MTLRRVILIPASLEEASHPDFHRKMNPANNVSDFQG